MQEINQNKNENLQKIEGKEFNSHFEELEYLEK